MGDRGLRVVQRNLRIGGGEIDVLAADGRDKVAVEVRTVTGGNDPIDAIGDEKRRRVQALASMVGADRSDFIGIRLHRTGIDLHWVPGPSR